MGKEIQAMRGKVLGSRTQWPDKIAARVLMWRWSDTEGYDRPPPVAGKALYEDELVL